MSNANEKSKGKLFQSHERKDKIVGFAAMMLIIIIAVAVLFPIWWIFRTSLMTNAEIYAYPPALIPKNWLFSNYKKTLEYFKFFQYLGNTMIVIVPSVLGGTFTATLGGYAFARLRFRGKKFLFTLCVGSMLLPSMVTLIPLYIMWTRGLGLGDSYWPLILPYFCGGGAFNIFLIRQFIMGIPRELDEAATIDGASHFRILTNILLPAIKPAMIVVALLLFITLWNDLLQQMVYINSSEKFTIAIGLTVFRGALKQDWSKTMAATCMSFAPGVIFYLIGQKYFVEGIALTGIKN
ncbi:carbohydrate ABC transporter permease [Lachnoclostridium phytofermentans]|uniref:Binding-protein-dependent transport systems inner membrane component n=1 Tax=Lachnoclostridium phytofermentans (strain ATCC 700394 / DSM 18823 / ISDg) TaxID=357809 RepID=A9KIY2_LACP7|nr:carbohydrate ABC transporter permease [Lachnoclostridium phytofermentans]ABX40981.1 binding-protein-dependent transport systems inner membrane component [Lachnoclostridium phytofermentans ISDg]